MGTMCPPSINQILPTKFDERMSIRGTNDYNLQLVSGKKNTNNDLKVDKYQNVNLFTTQL